MPTPNPHKRRKTLSEIAEEQRKIGEQLRSETQRKTVVDREVYKTITENSDGTVTIQKGITRDQGNFNSAKVMVSVTLPINPSKELISACKATIRIVDNLVNEELEKQVDEIM